MPDEQMMPDEQSMLDEQVMLVEQMMKLEPMAPEVPKEALQTRHGMTLCAELTKSTEVPRGAVNKRRRQSWQKPRRGCSRHSRDRRREQFPTTYVTSRRPWYGKQELKTMAQAAARRDRRRRGQSRRTQRRRGPRMR